MEEEVIPLEHQLHQFLQIHQVLSIREMILQNVTFQISSGVAPAHRLPEKEIL